MKISVEELADREAIRQTIFNLARSVDRCDEELMRSCFHSDATDDHSSFRGSADEFVKWVMPVLKSMERTQHTIGQVIVDLDGDTARTESYFIAYHRIFNENIPGDMFACGRYLDWFEKRDGDWKILHRHALYDWNKNDAATGAWDAEPAASIILRGDRSPNDSTYTMGGPGSPPEINK